MCSNPHLDCWDLDHRKLLPPFCFLLFAEIPFTQVAIRKNNGDMSLKTSPLLLAWTFNSRHFLWQIQLQPKWGKCWGHLPPQRKAGALLPAPLPSESQSDLQSHVCHDLISAPTWQTETTLLQPMTDGIENSSQTDFKSLVHHPFYSSWSMAKPPPY